MPDNNPLRRRLFEDMNHLDGYESPIQYFTTEVAHQIANQADENIWTAICKAGVTVDKDELIKAMQYDRHQYEQGYGNGLLAGFRKAIDVLMDMLEEG